VGSLIPSPRSTILLLFLFLACVPGSGPRVVGGGTRDDSPSPAVTGSAAPSAPDTLDGIGEATRLLRVHYRPIGPSASFRGRGSGGVVDRYCNGGEGLACHGGDPDRGPCPAGVPCHPDEGFLVEGLQEEALRYPTSGLLVGQAVYALTKVGRVEEAQEVVEACEAEAWWCEALQGYVLYSYAPLDEVEEQFRSALAEAPSDIACRWGDATWLLGDWDQRTGGMESLPPGKEATEDWDCGTLLAVSDTLWWLADPLLSVEGNDRWTTHIARAMAGQLHEDLRRMIRGAELPREEREWSWAMRIRRGPWDSWEQLPGRNEFRYWTSDEGARYHFIPELQPDDLGHPVWELQGDLQKEGYTPDYGTLYPIPVQIARFRRGDSLGVVAAGDLEASRLRRAVETTTHFVLSDAPGSLPLHLRHQARRERPILFGEAPPRRFLTSFEVFSDLGIGVNRQFISPLAMEGPEISDLLLFDSSDEETPDALESVLSSTLGSPRVEEGGTMGVFLEIYGAPAGTPMSFELTLQREAGGLVDRLVGLFPGGSREGRGRVAWTEPSAGDTHPRAVKLDLSHLSQASYELILRVSWDGRPPLERRKRFSVT